MLRRMLGVDSWLDVASLENVEEDHSFLFLKKNSMKIFFFFFNLKILNFFKELKILIGDFFLFLKQPKKYKPNAPCPKDFFWKFPFFFVFFEKPILWMRMTLAGNWCRLLDKSLLNSCKKIISISNGFIHWNELEVLTQCP